MNSKTYYVYILSNKNRTVLYIGVTNNLLRRIAEHQSGSIKGFSNQYHLHDLLYFEQTNTIVEAIIRKKQLKNWHRSWKLNLIKQSNPTLKDLTSTLL